MAQKLDVVVQRLGADVELTDSKVTPSPARGRLNTMEQANYRLMSVASVGDIDVLTELVEQKGVSTDARSFDNRTALHIAAAGGQFEAAKFLVNHKADINARDRFNSTPLDEAMKSESRSEPLIAYLIAQGAQITSGSAETSLINLCAQKASPANVALAESILKAKVNPDCADYDGRTPLHLAVAEANVTLAKLLLDSGANPLSQDRWKNTPWNEVKRHANRSGVNEMSELFNTHPSLDHLKEQHAKFEWTDFSLMFGGLQILMLILMFTTATYSESAGGGDAAVNPATSKMLMYPFFQDVNVMIFIGFGYLMVFLRKNAFNSLGVTFLACALVIQWHMLVDGFFVQAFCGVNKTPECGHGWHKIPLGLENMIFADFCAGAVMISYGALLGKVSPFQMCFIAIFEVIFFAINENFGKSLKVADIGGTIVIHMFGAYFGLAASVALKNKNASTHVNNSSVYHSDLMAMVGTVFLWLYWPSFNGATSGNPASQQRVVLNTFLSLSASCLMAFVASHLIRREKKFNMVDVQNATLAGGVAMGSAADMLLGPGAAVSIGALAGTLSVLGYVFVQPFLESKIGFHDTCGVNNLHGMPSILGALSGVIAASLAQSESFAGYGAIQMSSTFPLIGEGSRTAQVQAASHLAFIGITLAFALTTGFLTGLLVRSCTRFEAPDGEYLFNDASYWETPKLENPYYFDHRGEIQRGEDGRGESASSLESRLLALENRPLSSGPPVSSGPSATPSREVFASNDPRHIARAHIRRLIEDEQDKARLFAELDAKLIADLTDPHTNDGERLAALTLKLHPPNSAPETVLAQMWREILDNKKKGL